MRSHRTQQRNRTKKRLAKPQPLRRFIHFLDCKWSYQIYNNGVRIRSPDNIKTSYVTFVDLLGFNVYNNIYNDCGDYSVKIEPGDIRDYINRTYRGDKPIVATGDVYGAICISIVDHLTTVFGSTANTYYFIPQHHIKWSIKCYKHERNNSSACGNRPTIFLNDNVMIDNLVHDYNDPLLLEKLVKYLNKLWK